MMTKTQLIEKMVRRQGLSKAKTAQFVNDLFASIQDTVLSGDEVRVGGFGVFKPRQSRTKGLRSNGSRWERPAKLTIRFKPYFKSGANSSGAKGRIRSTTPAMTLTADGGVAA